ncbi:MAG TPA: histidine kinase dimerization/phosphoacceptor domain -containing protein [Spirochaetia bacterium]|nr:histidine kinase dimerization/phosphoacceptor domain -containing protein [Spirochaetia bacterium]
MKLYSIFPVAMGAVCLTIAFHEFMIWLRRKEHLFDLSFAGTCFFAGLYDFSCAAEYSVSAFLQSVPWLRAETISLNLVALAFLWYLSDRTRKIPRSHLLIFAGWCLFGIVTQLVGFGALTWDTERPQITHVQLPFGLSVQYLEVESGPLTNIQYFVGFATFVYFFWVIWQYRREHRKEAMRLYRYLGIVGCAYLSDFAVSFTLYSFIYLIEYGWLAAVIFITAERSRDLLEAGEMKRDLVFSEEKFRTFVEQSSEAIVLTDEAGTVITYNGAAERLTGIPVHDAVNRPIWSLALRTLPAEQSTPDLEQRIEQRYREALARTGESTLVEQNESVLRRPDGAVRFFQHHEFLIHTPRGYRIGTIYHDVTEIKRAQEQVLTSLQEKTVLLKEIHHRVKNNLQIISSLLYLQENRLDSEAARAALQDCRSQVVSMALVHEELYRSKDFSDIDFGGYLRRLVARLLGAYQAGNGITFVAEIAEELFVGVNQAIPCGLIVNELCTNVLRHAFPKGGEYAKRELHVGLGRKEGDIVALSVTDTGVGISPEINLEGSLTLGMQIVSKLVHQLQGILYVGRAGPGTRVEIDFPLHVRTKEKPEV